MGKKSKDKKKRKKKRSNKDKQKIRFILDDASTDEEIFDDLIKKLKKARSKVTKQNINELRFARDILQVINEVIIRYDRAMENGEFTMSPNLPHLARILNYMICAYQNIEKMLTEDNFKFLQDYYKILNLGGLPKPNGKFESKLGNDGKHHVPTQQIKRRRGNLVIDKKKKKKKKKKKRRKNK